MQKIVGRSNGSGIGNEFVALFNKIGQEIEEAERRWIAVLRSNGVKAAHPDDGWVDREKNTIRFAYSCFNDGVLAGDLIALGSPDKYRIVKVIEVIAPSGFFTAMASGELYRFE